MSLIPALGFHRFGWARKLRLPTEPEPHPPSHLHAPAGSVTHPVRLEGFARSICALVHVPRRVDTLIDGGARVIMGYGVNYSLHFETSLLIHSPSEDETLT